MELDTDEGWGLRSAGVEVDELRERADVFTVGRPGGDQGREFGSTNPLPEDEEGSMNSGWVEPEISE